MAGASDLDRLIRRRRIVAVVVFVIVVGVAAGVSWSALRRDAGAAATTHTTTTITEARQFGIIFPEGFTRLAMAARVKVVAKKAERESHGKVALAEQGYLAASRQAIVPCFGRAPQTNLEGFLFPATYDFQFDTTSRTLVRTQIQTFCQRFKTLDLRYARSKNLTDYDILKIASMVEEEAAVPRDRAKIAAVIYNRLHAHIPLGIDATLRYGLHIPPTQSITEKELQSSNPYNSRRLYGLPPTPIGNPGLASLTAAAHPSHAGYLYFVRVPGTNHHVFFISGDAYNEYLAKHHYGPHP